MVGLISNGWRRVMIHWVSNDGMQKIGFHGYLEVCDGTEA